MPELNDEPQNSALVNISEADAVTTSDESPGGGTGDAQDGGTTDVVIDCPDHDNCTSP
jgi:hypothetical protein